MSSEQFSLRLSVETKSRLEELAGATGRTKAYLAIYAIERYLDLEAWQISAIQCGLQDVENEKNVSIDKVKSDWGIK